jgi:N-acetylmuramoyl-L-alanine amidase
MIKQRVKDKTQKAESRGYKSGGLSSVVCHLFCVIYCLFYVFCLPSISSSSDIIEVKGLRHWSTSEYTRVAVDLSVPAEFTKGQLSNPERLFFDIKNARLINGLQTNNAVTDKFLKMIRIAQFRPTIVRIVFDIQTTDYDFNVFSFQDPAMLIIDIFPKGSSKDKADTKTESITLPNFLKKKIVIDPGHGGHDPGAIGPNGLYEKDVVLDIALKVRDIIKREYPTYEVILTRSSDVFIPLDKRAAIANKEDADLFVSIHTNASTNRLARGIETFILNWTDDEESMKVAARENAISLSQMKQAQTELGLILASLERESKRDESIKLAGNIQKALISNITFYDPMEYNRGLKQALFYVLVGAKMPSALVEISFISNPEEEKLLATESYRQTVAYSIVSGINAYFSMTPIMPQKVAVREKIQKKSTYKARSVKYTHR